MSGLRPAARHAPTGPGRQLRPQLVRAAVLPALAAALSGTAAVIFTLQLGGGAGERDPRLWPVLTGCGLLVLGALAAALLGAHRSAKAVRDRCEALRRSSARGRQELRAAADRLERGEPAARPVRGGPTGPPPGTDPERVDEFWLLSQELRGAREQAHAALVRLAGPAAPSDNDRKVEVFVNLARRLQSLVHREISLLDDLEDTVEDPDLLRELFRVDHLATRIRRHAENLAVLGGAASRRQWTRPIDLSEVLRSSVAEVEQYTRVKVVPPAGGTVRGHAVADVVHLLAELIENATVFSPPDTDVVVRAERVTSGIAVEVEDRGLGLPPAEQHRMNALLDDPDQISMRHLLADGRIGLYVVSALARRHGIAVELKSNIYGGVLAVLVLPQDLLGAEAPGGFRATSWGTGQSRTLVPSLEPVRPGGPAPEPLPGRSAPTPVRAVPGPRPKPAPAPRPATPEPHTGRSPLPDRDPAPGAGLPHPQPAGRAPRPPAPHPAGPGPRPGAGSAPGMATGLPEPAGARPAGPGPRPAPGSAPDAGPGAGSVSGLSLGAGLPEPVGARRAGPGSRPGAGSAPGMGPGLPEPVGVPQAAPGHADPGMRPGAGSAPDLGAGLPEPAGASETGPRHARPGAAPRGGPGLDPDSGAGLPGSAAPAPVAVPPSVPAARPPLPRRRAQEHLVAQLRDAPAPRPADPAGQAVHDPGLMAAFQRGYGLAQSEDRT